MVFSKLLMTWYLSLRGNNIKDMHKLAFLYFGTKSHSRNQIDLRDNQIRFLSVEKLLPLLEHRCSFFCFYFCYRTLFLFCSHFCVLLEEKRPLKGWLRSNTRNEWKTSGKQVENNNMPIVKLLKEQSFYKLEPCAQKTFENKIQNFKISTTTTTFMKWLYFKEVCTKV